LSGADLCGIGRGKPQAEEAECAAPRCAAVHAKKLKDEIDEATRHFRSERSNERSNERTQKKIEMRKKRKEKKRKGE
jgi:hypothetical protein